MQQISPGERIAVTGMALCNALGPAIEQVWPRTLDMASGIVRLTPQNLPGITAFPGLFAAPFVLGRNSYMDALGLTPRNFTRQDLRVPPQDLRVMSASTQLTLHTGHAAVALAGLDRAGYEPHRVGVFTSQNAAECASTLHPLLTFAHAEALARVAATHGRWDAATERTFVQALQAGQLQADEGSMLNRLNCTAAGKLCEMYGFAGPTFSVGAACASSMAALFAALPLLRDGTLDAALVGGGEEVFNPLFFIEFCTMGVLARPQPGLEQPEALSRPFDRRRSGFVLGEGAAMLVLERESCARRRGARIYGLITGMGGVTNNRSPIDPDATVQRQAIELSLRGLEYGPDAVELVECHATATVRGDREEALALAGVYGTGQGGRGAVLSAYKGQVGHCMGASGLMALIHGLLAMRDRVFPGILNCTEPDPDIPLADAGLRILHAPEPWDNPRGGVRRMQVNAFAFGGACYAVQVEEDTPRSVTRAAPRAEAAHEGTQEYAGTQDVVDGVRLVTLTHHGEEWRLGSTTPAWKQELAGLPQEPTPEDLAARARRGVWLHKTQEPPPVALMCCGQGSIWPGMGRALYDTFAPARAAMDSIAAIADWDILSLLDEPDLEKITLTRWQQPYLFLLEYAQASYLQSLGFTPGVISGHSLGELIALCLAGVYDLDHVWYVINTRAIQMAELEATASRDTGMLAVYAGEDVIADTLGQYPDLLVSNYNTPTQFILSGPTASLQEARRALRKRKFPAVMLNVSLAFHHPAMRVMRESASRLLGVVPLQPARLPMMSCVTTGLYPETPAEIIKYICDLDENPVRWVGCVQAMWEKYGVRHFVELGPTNTLCSLTTDIKPEALCLSASKKGHEVEAMRTLVARLHALGHLPRRAGHTETPPQAESPAPPQQAAASQAVPPHIEELMPILMSVTGYQRHELAPDMDLTQDLAIRSSRFPQIIHEAEERFGVSIDFEDLLGVATIRDLAEVLRRAREGAGSTTPDAATTPTDTGEAPLPLRRYVPEFLPLPTPTGRAQCGAGPVLLVTLAGSNGTTDNLLAQQWRQCLQALGATVYPCHGLTAAMERLEAPETVQGLVVCLPPAEADCTDPGDDLAQVLALLQRLLGRNPQALCVAAQYSAHAPVADNLHGSPLAAGLGGMFLALALEYPRALLRVVVATGGGDAASACPAWLPQALIRPPVTTSRVGETGGANEETAATRLCLWHVDADGALHTPGLKARACVEGRRGLPWRPGDVVLVSGGGRGITPAALRELAAMGCRLALLGRSQAAPEEVLRELADCGAPAVRHFPCNVTDSAAVERCLTSVQAEFGRVDGLIHAAGLIHDATLASCDPEKAALVIATKCRGLHNLLRASAPLGLRWAVAFSSLAGWLGNYGQSAYSAANRAMAALLQRECAARGIACRCLWLPPVAGAGMAQDTREQLRLRGLDGAWLDIGELGGLLCRTCAGTTATHALWARKLPHVPFAADAPAADARAEQGMVEAGCQPGNDAGHTAENSPGDVLVYPLSLEYGPPPVFAAGWDISHYADTLLTPLAERVFGQQTATGASGGTDPGTTMHAAAPWATPGLYVAALAHAAEVYAPWMFLLGLRRVRFTAPLPCPGGVTHQCRIHLEDTGLRLEHTPLGRMACRVVQARLHTPALAANGRRTAQKWDLCHAELLLAAQPPASLLAGGGGDCSAMRELALPVAPMQESVAVLEKKRYTALRYWCDTLLCALRLQAAQEAAATECVWWSALDALWVVTPPLFTEAAASFAPLRSEDAVARDGQPNAPLALYDACLYPATARTAASLCVSGASLCAAPPPLRGGAHGPDAI